MPKCEQSRPLGFASTNRSKSVIGDLYLCCKRLLRWTLPHFQGYQHSEFKRVYNLLIIWGEGYGVGEGCLDDMVRQREKSKKVAITPLRSICMILSESELSPHLMLFCSSL